MTSELSDLSIDKFLNDWSSLEEDKGIYIILYNLNNSVAVVTGSCESG